MMSGLLHFHISGGGHQDLIVPVFQFFHQKGVTLRETNYRTGTNRFDLLIIAFLEPEHDQNSLIEELLKLVRSFDCELQITDMSHHRSKETQATNGTCRYQLTVIGCSIHSSFY